MGIFKGKNILDFLEVFPDDDACKAYLAELKWHDGFVCPKCGHEKGCLKKGYRYHCYGCGKVESSTAGTLFHKVKFGLRKAFCIVFEMSTSSQSLSSIQMGERYGIRQATAWYFMQKVRKAMDSSRNHPLEGTIHVDEFVVGGYEENKRGRSYNTNKTKVIIAIELSKEQKIKRAYAKVIDDYSAKSFTPLFEQHISKDAKVITDKWKGYSPLKREYNIEQIPSNKGRNFKKLHIIIHKIKSWLRTIHAPVSKQHMERYLYEYVYRLNRSRSKNTIFHNNIVRMLKAEPWLQKQIIKGS